MTNPYFSETERWCLPDRAVPEALAEMALDGCDGNEGIVLFFGKDRGSTADVSHLVRLRGSGISKSPVQIRLSAELMNDVADAALELGVRLVGQVHSHGRYYGVQLSPTDRMYGIQAPFYLSLVAPDYAMSAAPIEQWGAHVFMEGQGYVQLNRAEAVRRIQLVPAKDVLWITVGGTH